MGIRSETFYSGFCNTCNHIYGYGSKMNFKDPQDIINGAKKRGWEVKDIEHWSTVELKCPKCIKEGK